jgi:hypothetical protein
VSIEVITQVVTRQSVYIVRVEVNYECVRPAEKVSSELDFLGFAAFAQFASLFVRVITSKSL